MIDDLIDFILVPLLLLLGAFALFTLFVYVPVGAVAQAKCLEEGYPKSTVTWKLDRYCMNLEGTVTVAVKELE